MLGIYDNWYHTIYGNYTWVDSNIVIDTSLNIIANKIFYDEVLLEIEYTFSVTELFDTTHQNMGIVLDYYGECYWYFYIGLNVFENNFASLFIANVTENDIIFMEEVINIFTLKIDPPQFYTLRVEVVNNTN